MRKKDRAAPLPTHHSLTLDKEAGGPRPRSGLLLIPNTSRHPRSDPHKKAGSRAGTHRAQIRSTRANSAPPPHPWGLFSTNSLNCSEPQPRPQNGPMVLTSSVVLEGALSMTVHIQWS